MRGGPREVTEVHTRLSKCALEVNDARAYWAHADETTVVSAQQAFDEYWFGARSMTRVKVLLINMHARFGAFPSALAALHRWSDISPETRRTICHWHLQLTDILYRRFAGALCVPKMSSMQVKRPVGTRGGCRRVDRVVGCRGTRAGPVR